MQISSFTIIVHASSTLLHVHTNELERDQEGINCENTIFASIFGVEVTDWKICKNIMINHALIFFILYGSEPCVNWSRHNILT